MDHEHAFPYDMTMDELMQRWPKAVGVLLDFKMLCVGCPIATFHTITDACDEHGISEDEFRGALMSEVRPG